MNKMIQTHGIEDNRGSNYAKICQVLGTHQHCDQRSETRNDNGHPGTGTTGRRHPGERITGSSLFPIAFSQIAGENKGCTSQKFQFQVSTHFWSTHIKLNIGFEMLRKVRSVREGLSQSRIQRKVPSDPTWRESKMIKDVFHHADVVSFLQYRK